MHHAWLVEDIRQLLMEAVADDPPDSQIKQTRRNLFNLALVCHLFTEIATDHLWRDLPDMTPVLRLMPSLRFNKSGTHVVSLDFDLTLWPILNLGMNEAAYRRAISECSRLERDIEMCAQSPGTHITR